MKSLDRIRQAELPWLAFGALTGLLLARFAFGWGWLALAGAVLGVGGAAIVMVVMGSAHRARTVIVLDALTNPEATRRIAPMHLPVLTWGATFGGMLFSLPIGFGWATLIGIVCGVGGAALALLVVQVMRTLARRREPSTPA